MGATMDATMDWEQAKHEAVRLKHPPGESPGWSPRMRQRFGYFTPDECYEAKLLLLVGPETTWLDVGCGAELLPANRPLARLLSERCRRLVGLDPSDNILRNTVVHERAQCMLEDYPAGERFDLISMRMVAEHIENPEAAVAALARLLKPGGRVVVYTVNKWSPASVLAAVTPMAFHHWLKRILWSANPIDTFPTVYLMNSRKELRRLFEQGGMREEAFHYLDDCRAFARWPATLAMELGLLRVLRGLGLRYPELCLLGVYRTAEASVPSGD
jgi:SAM-dependent methyltransferase